MLPIHTSSNTNRFSIICPTFFSFSVTTKPDNSKRSSFYRISCMPQIVWTTFCLNSVSAGVIYHVLARSTETSCLGLSVFDAQLRPVEGLDAELCVPDVFSTDVSSLLVTGVTRRDGALSYRALVTTRDAAVIMFQREGRVVWSREEALSEVRTGQWVAEKKDNIVSISL